MFFPDAFDTALMEWFGFHHEDIRWSSSAEHQVPITTYSLPKRSQAVSELFHSVDSPSPSYHEKYAIGVTEDSSKASEKEHLSGTRRIAIVGRGLTLSQECQTHPLLSPRRSLAALSESSHSSATKRIQASETLDGLESDKESQDNVRTTSQPPVQRHNEPPVGDCKTKGPPKSDVNSNRRQNPTSQSKAFLHQNSNTDCVDECAIDDDSEWEDSIKKEKMSGVDEKTVFQRVDIKDKPTSHCSLITMMMAGQNNRGGVGDIASRSTSVIPWSRDSNPAPSTLAVSPNDSDDAPLMMKRGNRSQSLKPVTEVPRSARRSISKTASRDFQDVLNPRITRRKLVKTELPEPVRRNVSWERQQNSATTNPVPKRRLASHDVANLKHYPEIAWTTTRKDRSVDTLYFAVHTADLDGFNTKGW